MAGTLCVARRYRRNTVRAPPPWRALFASPTPTGRRMPPKFSSRVPPPRSQQSRARWRRRASRPWSSTTMPRWPPNLPGIEYMITLSAHADARRVLQGGAEAQARAAAQRRLRQCRPRSRAARQGAALEQWRRERDLGLRARADADAHRRAQGDLAARQRVGRTLARQRAGAAHVRAARQDARHHRLRHHRQEGGAARARRSACMCSISTSRASPRRGGRSTASNSACCASCCAPPTSCRCTCR